MLKSSSFIILFILCILAVNSIYAENSSNSISTSNNHSNFKNTNDTTFLLSYKFEPFLLLDETTFKDILHEQRLALNNFAIAAWIKSNQSTISENAYLANKGGFNSEKKGKNMNYGIWFSEKGRIQGGFETEFGKNFQVNSTAKYNDGKWHYILLSYDGSILRLDIDGKQVSDKNTNGALPDTNGKEPLQIGENSLENDKHLSSYIDKVRVWNRGLTDAEISKIYTNGIFNTIGQVVYLDFTESDISTEIVSRDTNKTLTTTKTTNKTTSDTTFNIGVAADWGCEIDTKKTSQNIQDKNPELVIAPGDLSYKKSAKCWFEIIQPFKSKTKIAMGDHEYSDTSGGVKGIINQYLKPLNLEKTYYSFEKNNIHFTIMDPYIDYYPDSAQYHFIEEDLRNATSNPKIDWTFVVESIPMYTSPSQHPGNSTIRDIYHPLFDKYGVDLVFSGDNHNYQRTFPLRYNYNDGDSSNPIIVDRNQNNYYNNNDNGGVIYLIIGTAGRSLYEVKEQAPFIAQDNDKHFGFLNINIDDDTVKGTFYANESQLPSHYYGDYQNIIIDHFTISKQDKWNSNNNTENVNTEEISKDMTTTTEEQEKTDGGGFF